MRHFLTGNRRSSPDRNPDRTSVIQFPRNTNRRSLWPGITRRQANRRLRLSSPNHNVKDLGSAGRNSFLPAFLPRRRRPSEEGPAVGRRAFMRPRFRSQRRFAVFFTTAFQPLTRAGKSEFEKPRRERPACQTRPQFPAARLVNLVDTIGEGKSYFARFGRKGRVSLSQCRRAWPPPRLPPPRS